MDNNNENDQVEENIDAPSVTSDSVNSGSSQETITETAVPQAQTTKPAPVAEKSDWDKFEELSQDSHDYIETPYEQNAWLLSTKFRDKDIMKLHDLILKELSTSHLQDPEQALIYSIKMDCVSEWLALFPDGWLCKQRMAKMLFRLNLGKSVEGIENIMQHGTSSVGMSLDKQGNLERQPYDPSMDAQQQQQPGGGRFSFSNLIKKWKK